MVVSDPATKQQIRKRLLFPVHVLHITLVAPDHQYSIAVPRFCRLHIYCKYHANIERAHRTAYYAVSND
jgi:hypothetical protein